MNLLNKREIEILRLLSSNKEYQTGESMAVLLGVSSRTIRNDVKSLNNILLHHGAKINSKKGRGYELEFQDHDAFSWLNVQALGASEHRSYRNMRTLEEGNLEDVIIGKLLINTLSDTSMFQEELANELYISLSTLKSYFQGVKKKVSRFDLKVVTDRFNGISLQGEENKIRFCISEYLFNDHSMTVYNDLFPKQELEQLKEITLKVLYKHKLKLTDLSLERFIIHMGITINRHKNECYLTFPTEVKKCIQTSKEFIIAEDIVKEIFNGLSIDITSEIYYIAQHLMASSRLTPNEMNTDEYTRLEEMLRSILVTIKRKTSIDLSMEHDLIEGIITHLNVALKRIEYGMSIRNEFLPTIKNNYPLAFELAVIASNEIKDLTQLTINENEIGYLAIHFGVALEKMGLNKRTMKRVLIVCGAGLATASLIRERITNMYGEQISIIESISLREFTEGMLEKVDLVVSTIPIPHIISTKIIVVSPILTNKDLSIIYKKMKEDEDNPVFISYQDVFKKDLFKREIDLDSKEAVLQYMTKLMMKKGYIDDQTLESIFERERMASTELGQLVAIPHPLENHMSEVSIAVCVLKKPIIWDKEKVQVVILLSVPKEKQKWWETIFKKLYLFLIEDFGVTKMISEYSYEDFIRNLVKYKEK
jgi:lichenan operon transcriptional antiterminator